uniref:Uncharacterized protein n=1 Tax=Physcomitrium patens TaxID=3218 RepID=A0A2K1K7P6_PHYPA|nr:hypothetical protein PHYPA_011688 [Physcomitrium patens]
MLNRALIPQELISLYRRAVHSPESFSGVNFVGRQMEGFVSTSDEK